MPDEHDRWSIASARALADHGVGRVVDKFLARAEARCHGRRMDAPRARDTTARSGRRARRNSDRRPRRAPAVRCAGRGEGQHRRRRLPTTAGSHTFSYTPAASAPVVQRLLDAGALCTGKTNLDQFATGLAGTRAPDFGICPNPIDPAYVTGGSSTGSAALVARGVVPLALGTDTAVRAAFRPRVAGSSA